MRRVRIAWTIATVNVLVFVVTSLYQSDGGLAAAVLYLLGLASFAAVGAVLITRVPENPMGSCSSAPARCW